MENAEKEYLEKLIELEDLAEKKTKIYSRLLTEPYLAKELEKLSLRHEKRREQLELLLYGKIQKEGGRSALNGKGEEE